MAIKHSLTSLISDDSAAVSAGQVVPSDWNDDHTIEDNTITNAMIASGLDAAKIGGGSVSNTEFSYLDGVTSAIQTQLDAKQASDATLTALAGVSAISNKIPYFTGTDVASVTDILISSITSSASAPTGIAFTGTTAPSGVVTYDSSFQQIGKRASGIISIYYATAGSAITTLVMDWPSGWPAPVERGGFTAASIPQYIGRGYAITATATTLTNGSTFCGIRRNAADSAYEIAFAFSSGSYRAFIMQFEWDVA